MSSSYLQRAAIIGFKLVTLIQTLLFKNHYVDLLFILITAHRRHYQKSREAHSSTKMGCHTKYLASIQQYIQYYVMLCTTLGQLSWVPITRKYVCHDPKLARQVYVSSP